jgi:DNA-binding response OmpR family regulator
MRESAKVLVACSNEHLYEGLNRVLQPLGLEVFRVFSCAELQSRLREGADFLAVLAETSLPDGNWRSAQMIVSRAADRLPLIVVSPFVDLTEYLDTLESGAADYVVPPFLGTDIAHVLMAAVGNAHTGPGAMTLPRRIAGTAC